MPSEQHRQQPQAQSGKLVLQGAVMLGGAALLSKLIGTLQKIPIQNIAGDEVFGLYSAVYAIAVMWMTLAAAGIPTAISILVAEREARGDAAGAQRMVRWALGLLSTSGLIAFALMQLGAPFFADWIGAADAEQAIRTSSIALLIAPAVAVLRGRRQGQLRMARAALSQVLEQTARVAFMLILLYAAIRSGWEAAATTAALHGGLAAGAAAGLAVMLWPKRSKPVWVQPVRAGEPELAVQSEKAVQSVQTTPTATTATTATTASTAPTATTATTATTGNPSVLRQWHLPERTSRMIKRMIAVALPVAAASIVVPLLGLIDAVTIPRLLQRGGIDASAAISAFGVYNRGIALLQLVLMAASGAAAALVPALTAARKQAAEGAAVQDTRPVIALRMAWWLGGAAALGLALLAVPIDIALFTDDQGSAAIRWLAPAALFGTLQAMSSGVLQGRGDLRGPAVNLAVAAVLKLSLNVLLVPTSGVEGAAMGMSIAYGAAALLNALSLRQHAPLPPVRPAGLWRPAVALAVMAAAVAAAAWGLGALTQALPTRAAALLVALPATAVGVLALGAALIATGAVGPSQWRMLPGCAPGSRLDAALSRLYAGLRRQKSASQASRKDDRCL